MADATTETGKTTTCTEEESTHGKMVDDTKENTLMIENMVTVYMFGRMEDSIRAVGKMANSTEKVSINKQTDKNAEVFGKTVNALSGQMSSDFICTGFIF